MQKFYTPRYIYHSGRENIKIKICIRIYDYIKKHNKKIKKNRKTFFFLFTYLFNVYFFN